MKYIYKTEIFGCSFDSKKKYNEKLQTLLNKYSQDGWRLHTMQLGVTSSYVCVCIFEKEDKGTL